MDQIKLLISKSSMMVKLSRFADQKTTCKNLNVMISSQQDLHYPNVILPKEASLDGTT